jgi:predicted RNA-binding protein YlxR (DUF448 family)
MKSRPQRSCIACRQVRDKQQLVRLVRTTDGGVEVDSVGRRAGRGAYLCRSYGCWEKGLKGSYLERALRISMDQDKRDKLREYVATFDEE